MKTEQSALKISFIAILTFAALGISFGLVSGSYAIIFDGVFSLVDALMSIVSIAVSTLILRSTSQALGPRMQQRFTMGFWHFEPLVLAINALLMIVVGSYALVQSVLALMSGGRDIEFGPAVVYAAIILVLTVTVGTIEYRANKKINSALVAMDVKGWVMAGGVTGALLIAFLLGIIIDGTRFEWMMPYVDPAVLALVTLVLIPVPLPILRTALADLALVTPQDLRKKSEDIAEQVRSEQGFLDFRAYAAQVGRATQVEINFQVPEGTSPRALEEWDSIRRRIQDQLGADDPNNWITVTFSTHAL